MTNIEQEINQLKQEIAKTRTQTQELAKEKDKQIAELTAKIQGLKTPTKAQENNIVFKQKVGILNDHPDHPLVVEPARGGTHLVINDRPKAKWGLKTGKFNLAFQNTYNGEWETQMLITKEGKVIIATDEFEPLNPYKDTSLAVKGNIDFGTDTGGTISTKGIMHLNGEENLYILNKKGVIIGKEWGGNGNLTVQGNIEAKGEIKGKIWYSQEYQWKQGQPPVKMNRSNKTVAFLTSIQGSFEGDNAGIKIYESQGYWYLSGDSSKPNISATARCMGMP